jgi:hypothetical protein
MIQTGLQCRFTLVTTIRTLRRLKQGEPKKRNSEGTVVAERRAVASMFADATIGRRMVNAAQDYLVVP